MSDPLGLSPMQRWQSDRNERMEAFVQKWGDRILMADDGTWYVQDGEMIVTVDLPPWPDDDPVRPANLAQARRIARGADGAAGAPAKL